MKKQTFIAFFKDQEGNNVTFERFSCKRLTTVKAGIKTLWDSPLYRVCTKNATFVEIYETEYSPAETDQPAAIVTL